MNKKKQKVGSKERKKKGSRATKVKNTQVSLAPHKKKSRRASDWIREIIKFFSFHRDRAFTIAEIAQALKAKSNSEKALIKQVVDSLYQQKRLEEVSPKTYRMPRNEQTFEAIYQREAGEGYVEIAEKGELVYIEDRRSRGARVGDKVEVAILATKRGIRIGEVLSILAHAKEDFIGVIHQVSKNSVLVSTADRALEEGKILIPLEADETFEKGDKVEVHIIQWQEDAPGALPLGKIKHCFGKAGDNDTEMHAILAEFGLPYKYPEKCIAEAEKIEESITEEEVKKREDFRNVLTFTIDPKDAKDFDDALSIRYLGKDKVEVGVHIADVSHYVVSGSILDEEAYARATSIYLVDRTIPMLPDRLCNNICSLRPQEEKLSFSVIFILNSRTAEVEDYRIKRTIIKSDRRYTYEEAQACIDTGEGDYAQEIMSLHQLAQLIRKRRFEKGGVRFESQELRFVLDERGFPIDVAPVAHGTANELIEEFMLLANKTVAEHIGKKKKEDETPRNFVYRVHADPDLDKLNSARDFLYKSHILKRNGEDKKKIKIFSTSDMNRLFEETSGTPMESLVSMLLLRSMARAEYTTQNIGHYGLAFPFYTHFTSPIRRYPDIMVHRLLAYYLFDEGETVAEELLEEKCRHASDQERVADSAERASVKYKQAEYLESKKNKVFDGYITGVTEWGLYVTLLHSGCEGLLPIRYLDDDFYRFDEDNYCLVGSRYRRKYILGQELRVRVSDVDKDRRLIDFELVD